MKEKFYKEKIFPQFQLAYEREREKEGALNNTIPTAKIDTFFIIFPLHYSIFFLLHFPSGLLFAAIFFSDVR